MQGGGDIAQRWLGAHLAPLGAVPCGCRAARAVAVDERGDEPAVDVAGHRRVLGPRGEAGDALLAVPVRLQLVTGGVLSAAAVAVRDVVGIGVLEGGAHVRTLAPPPRVGQPTAVRSDCGSTTGSRRTAKDSTDAMTQSIAPPHHAHV